MQRTQIYLDPAQKRDLSQISRRRRATVSELIRQAIEEFLQKNPSGLEEAIENTFGLWKAKNYCFLGGIYLKINQLAGSDPSIECVQDRKLRP